MKKILCLITAVALCLTSATVAFAVSDNANGIWADKNVVLKGTNEAELSVRVGDIDGLNDEYAEENAYNPFSAKDQYSHGYPWVKDDADPEGTDKIYVGSKWNGDSCDGYCGGYIDYVDGNDTENAYGKGALKITMNYDISGIQVKNALLQLCIDDFQPLSWESNYTLTINGKDAPFVSELINHVDQTGPTSYIISAIIPSGFFSEIASGKLEIVIDETTGCGDGYAIDFAKLLVNYNDAVFTGKFTGWTEPGATVRLLGTSTTVVAGEDGSFEFKAVPGLNAVRASKDGYVEGYDYGIVLSTDTDWSATIYLDEGVGKADIDFSQFGITEAWSNASDWAMLELTEASDLGLIPECLDGADFTQSITRAEFAAVSVKVYEALSGQKVVAASQNPFSDCSDAEVLKAYNLGSVTGTSATTFEPNALLNREQAATMLTRVFKKVTLDGWTVSTDGQFADDFKALFEMPALFADDTNISDWAKDSVYFMNAKGIINGVGNNMFAPQNTTDAEAAIGYANATREQALLIAARMVQKLR